MQPSFNLINVGNVYELTLTTDHMQITAWFKKISNEETYEIKIDGIPHTSQLMVNERKMTLLVHNNKSTIHYSGGYDQKSWKKVVELGKKKLQGESSSESSSSSSSEFSSEDSDDSSDSEDSGKSKSKPSKSKVYYAYSDGGARPSSGGPGGYGSAIFAGKPKQGDKPILEKHQSFPKVTNGKMEMHGVLEVLKLITKLPKGSQVTVHVDATYVLDTIGRGDLTNPPTGWIKGWHAKGWKLAGGGQVKNLELVKEIWKIIPKIAENYQVKCVHIKSHSNDYGNEYVDRLTWM